MSAKFPRGGGGGGEAGPFFSSKSNRLATAEFYCICYFYYIVIKIYSMPFYLITYGNFASLLENFHISLLKWTSTYMFGIEV